MASTFINKDEILRKIKLLLNIKSDINDDKLVYIIDLIIDEVGIYTNISIKRGDTTIEFNTSNILSTMKSVGYIEQEIRLLNNFRRVKMR